MKTIWKKEKEGEKNANSADFRVRVSCRALYASRLSQWHSEIVSLEKCMILETVVILCQSVNFPVAPLTLQKLTS